MRTIEKPAIAVDARISALLNDGMNLPGMP